MRLRLLSLVILASSAVAGIVFVAPQLLFADYDTARETLEQTLSEGESNYRRSRPHVLAAIALVAQEDRRLFERTILGRTLPLDLQSCLRATAANLKAGGVREGCSTLAMQLAKIAMPAHARTRTLKSKLYQMRLSFETFGAQPDVILQSYLRNLPCASEWAKGFDQCALLRFERRADEINEAEAIVLASAVQAPGRDLQASPEAIARARARLARVLTAAVVQGMLTIGEANRIAKQPVNLAAPNRTLARAEETGRDYDFTRDLIAATRAARANALKKQGHHRDLIIAGAVFDTNGKLLAFAGDEESWLDANIEAGSWIKPFAVQGLLDAGIGADYLDGNVQIPLKLPLYTRTFKRWRPRNVGRDLPERAVPMRYIMQSINTATLATMLYAFVYVEPSRAQSVLRSTLSDREMARYDSPRDRALTRTLASQFAGLPLGDGDVQGVPGYRQMTLGATRLTLAAARKRVEGLEVPHEDLAAMLGVVRAPWRSWALGLVNLWTDDDGLTPIAELMARYGDSGTLRWLRDATPEVYKTATAERNAGVAALMFDECAHDRGPYLVTFIALRPSGEAITPVQGGTLAPGYRAMLNMCRRPRRPIEQM